MRRLGNRIAASGVEEIMKRIPKLFLIAALAISTVYISAETAHACSCMMPEAEFLFENAEAAFEGRASEVPDTDGFTGEETVRLVFEVDAVYKGAIGETVVVNTSGSSASCGLSVAQGEDTTLFLYKNGADWNGDLCSQMEAGALQAAGFEPIPFSPEANPTDEAATATTTARWVLGGGVLAAVAAVVVARRRTHES